MIKSTILHYKILEKLGEGGMGVVYKAEDMKLKREVAIKFLPQHIASNEEERKRFEIEAQAAASLNHPNIATIYSIEESDDDTFIVMEYIDGIELKEKIKSDPIPVHEAVDIISKIAEGLKAAHKKNIVHRDIKSSNVMIDEEGKVKVMDFGLAKVGSAHITKLGLTIGTAAYMSPEQARSEIVDHRSDIWSLGIILFEMFTGKLPFKGEFEQAVIYSILNEEPESLLKTRNDIPLKLEQILFKLLSKDKNKRYQSADDFLKDIQEIKGNSTGVNIKDDEKTIAVLPFENISPDKETDYFADGLAEELIINLSRIKDVKVVARTNSIRYKDSNKDISTIGRELGVRYILTGSVRKFKDDLRISVQMIEVNKGMQLWGETYKGKLADIFDIQETVSKEIVEAMMLKLTPVEKVELTKRPTLNAEAFDCYLRGRNFLLNRTKNNLDFAILLFEKAVELDPRFAAAYAGLGEAYAMIYRDFDRRESLLDKALEVSLKALMYDSSLSEAYATIGLTYYGKGSIEEGLKTIRKAIELDPNNYNAFWILGRILHTIGEDWEAIESLEKAVELSPEFLEAYDDLRMYYEGLGEKEKHSKIIQKQLEIYPKHLLKHPEDAYRHMAYAVSLAIAGRIDEAKNEGERALDLSPDDPIMMYYGACLYARFNENKYAVELLGNAIKNGYQNYEWIKRDPDFDSIRNEPSYIELMKDKN